MSATPDTKTLRAFEEFLAGGVCPVCDECMDLPSQADAGVGNEGPEVDAWLREEMKWAGPDPRLWVCDTCLRKVAKRALAALDRRKGAA